MTPDPLRVPDPGDPGLALVLTGGGARAAYQVGVLRHLAARYPDLAPGILTGVSAGGMIAMHLASRRGRFADSVAGLAEIWAGLRTEHVCGTEPVDLTSWITRWGLRLIGGGRRDTAKRRSLVCNGSLRRLLTETLGAHPDGTLDGVRRNLQSGAVRSVALTASSYLTGQSVTWVQRREGFGALIGDGARHESLEGGFGVDHVMASGALPFIFPAVEIDGAWYGDGGMRLTAPLSPAIEMGARKIIAVSTRHSRSVDDAPLRTLTGHPQPGQVAGTLLNAIFLDMLDADALRLQQRNELIERLPAGHRGDLHRTDVLVLRPSQDLGRLANDFEADLPRGLRFFVRGGGRTPRSNDVLSLLMFQRDYILRLIDLGEADARMQASEIAAFLAPDHRPDARRTRPAAAAEEARPARTWRKSLFDTSTVPTPALAG